MAMNKNFRMAELIPKNFLFWNYFGMDIFLSRRNASATSLPKTDDGHNRLFIHFY